MTSVTTPYIGNGHYCYANVTTMLLASVGEHREPGVVEVLTGMGIGAHWSRHSDLIFFDSSGPDTGITSALGLLGFQAAERVSTDADPPPWHELAAALATGPAILGPLDIGLLTHVPRRGQPSGIDHYVLAYEMTESEVFFHDPAGYPHVSLPREALAEAWRAEQVGYRRGAYHWWAPPQRVAQPTDAELFRGLLDTLVRNYQQAEARAPSAVGGAAILQLAKWVRGGDLPKQLLGHLTAFAFQVGARRAGDFAAYFGGRAAALAELKQRQAQLFGRCHTLFVRKDWQSATESLVSLAAVEDQFRDALFAAG